MAKGWLAAGILLACAALAAIAAMLNMDRYTRTETDSGELFPRPLVGYAPNIHGIKEDTQLVYMQILWSELEPEEGVFDWEKLEKENQLDQLRERGVHLVIRLVCDYPGKTAHRDIPQWLYEKTGDGVDYDISYGRGYSPNYANPILIAAHAKAVAALGEHFGGDTLVSYVELGSLGHWGEWHVKTSAGLPPIPKADIREQYVQPWADAFPQAKLLMRRPFTHAAERGFGVYNDMAGHPDDTAVWLDWIRNGGAYEQTREKNGLVPMEDAWRTAPVGGEFTSSIPMEEMLDSELSRTVELLRESHTTFLGPKVAKEEFGEGYAAVLNAMGYRIGISKIEVNEVFGHSIIVLTWENNGVAPLYWNWPVKLYLEKPDGTVETMPVDMELQKLQPGEAVVTETRAEKVLKTVRNGGRLLIGVEDPMTGRDCVRLAMGGRWENGRNLLLTAENLQK